MKKRNGHRNGSNKLKEQTDKLLSTVALACLVGMTLLALYTGKGDQEYYEVQGGLFVCCILEILVSFVIIKYERSVVYSALLKLWKNDFLSSTENYTSKNALPEAHPDFNNNLLFGFHLMHRSWTDQNLVKANH